MPSNPNGYPAGTELGPSGHPKGSILDSPYARPIPTEQVGKAIQGAVGGGPVTVPRNDVAFQQPSDPLKGGSTPEIVLRDIPLISTVTSWTVDSVRSAMSGTMEGVFDLAGQFCDAVLGDDRVQATMGSRLAGLWGREVRFRVPKGLEDSSAAKEVLDAWADHWPAFEECEDLEESHTYGALMGGGGGYGQVVWDTSGSIWKPYPRHWHPRYIFYHWPSRRYVAISQDGLVAIVPGDGKWYGYEPYAPYRGWVRGAIRALAEPWLGLRFSRRDWWRFNEVHGIPTRKGYAPAAADPTERAQFEKALSQLGSETTILLPRGVDKDMGYDYELEEAVDTNWESFERTINECHLAIVLTLKWQNLTTEITAGGSYAAAKEHGKGEVSQVASDNKKWRKTLRRDFARPFALYNFGDADLAPITDRDVPDPPREDYAGNAEVASKVATALSQLQSAGFKFSSDSELGEWLRRRFGMVEMPNITQGEAPAVTTAKAAASTAEATHKTADAAVKKANEPPPEPASKAPPKDAP